MDKRSRLDLIHGYQEWIQDYVDQDWDPYEISFMYRPLPGGKQSILEQMKREIYRVNSRLVTRFDRDPRSEAGFNRLPRMMLFPDLPVYKRKKRSLNDVSINDGLHYGGIALTPPISRFRSTLDTYFEENQKKYVNKRLARIHVEPIISNDWYVIVANQRERQEKLENAAQCLTGLTSDLCQLDLYHLQNFALSYKTPTGRTKYNRPSELFAEIEFATRVIAACQEAYSSIFKAPVKKRGPRPLPYVDATQELIDLWEQYTHKKVPVSKTYQRQVTTNAAQFIRLGLSLIDPDVSDANVVTAINNALTQSSQRRAP